MSRYHENIAWQSVDGTWSRGFYRVAYYPEDPDDEWGVEFSDEFQWVSSGHRNQHDALRAWGGANPGYTDILNYERETAAAVLDLDVKAAELEDRDRANPSRLRYLSGAAVRDYNGPSKANNPVVLKARAEKAGRDLAELKCNRLAYRLRGYSNDVTGQIADTTNKLADLTARATAAGATGIDDGSPALLDGLRQVKTHADDDARRESRYSGYGYSPIPQSKIDARQDLERDLAKAEKAVAAAGKAARKSATKKAAHKKAVSRMSTTSKTAGAGAGRVAAGVPSGGQFAARGRAEAQVDLTGGTPR
ncbi:MAG: hypothetical protein M3Y35_04695 [Actinomycetota bacterium]|nr:hypothetical protein [Actinomycetota bacterium]